MEKIRFIKEFCSPVFGVVYFGKVVEVKKSIADKYLSSGFAELVVDEKPESVTEEKTKPVKKKTYKRKK